jgi:hypothetical protein
MAGTSGKVIIISAPDGRDLVAEIRTLLRDEPVEFEEGLSDSLKPWDAAVVLFVITPESTNDPVLADHVRKVVDIPLPIVPIVKELAGTNFELLPPSLEHLRERNAVSIKAEDGLGLAETVAGYLGLESFAQSRKVFISYKRTDTKQEAEAIYDYLWQQKYQVFMDTLQMEGGVVVQERVKQQINDKDLVLLLDSVGAPNSKWVIAELVEAAARRVHVCAVLTTATLNSQLLRDMPRVSWDKANPRNLEQIRLLVSRTIASRDSLDQRITRTIQKATRLKNLKLETLERRRLTISNQKSKYLLEFEDQPVSLERLHRLYLSFKALRRCKGAFFVGGDYPVIQPTRDAVTWARGKTSLEVLPLSDLYWVLNELFP